VKTIRLCAAMLSVFAVIPVGALCQANPAVNSIPSVDNESAAATTIVSGTVRTALNAPVPGATVRIVHLPSGRSWVSWTNDDGKFSFPDLPPGSYRLEVRQLGFGRGQAEMNFAAGTTAEAQLTLHVDISPTPTVEPKSETETAANSATPGNVKEEPGSGNAPEESTPVAPKKVPKTSAHTENVPNAPSKSKKGKKIDSLSAAGAVPGSDVSSTPDEAASADALSMGGTVNRASTLGAAGSFGRAAGSAGAGNGSPDSSATANAFPVAGQDTGATVSSPKASKSKDAFTAKKAKEAPVDDDVTDFGQGIDQLYSQKHISRLSVNRVHLSVTNRFDVGVWDARPYALAGTTPVKVATYDNIFDMRVGGPLSIPHVFDGHQRTFFFFSTEIDRAAKPLDSFTTVPTEAERGGNFSDTGMLLYDPASSNTGTRTLLGTSIPRSRMDQAALGMLPYIPLPNLPGLVNNYHIQGQLPASISLLSFRVVHTISPVLNVSAGYSASISNIDNPYDFPGISSNTSGLGQSVTLTLNQNLTSRLINSTKVNWTRNGIDTLGSFAYKNNIVGALGIQNVSQNPVDWGLPAIHFTNFNEWHDIQPALQKNQTMRLMDSVMYSLPKHTLHVGGEVRWMQVNADANPTPRGDFEFTGLMTSQLDSNGFPVPNTGFDFADFLLGLPENATVGYGLGSPYTQFRSRAYVAYAQDDWRVRPNFAINYGLRYELVTPPVELYNRISDLVINPQITAVTLVQPGQVDPYTGEVMPRSLIKTNKNNWGPRIGIAWRLPSKLPMVFRAGYGIFYNEGVYNQLAASIAIQPPFANAQILQTSTANVLTLENSFVQQPSSNVTNTVAIDPNYRVGYAQLWNVSMESQVTPNLVIDVNYNGTKGTHLDLLRAPNRASPGSPLSTDLNRRIPNAPGFVYDTSGAYSMYEGMQLIVRRQTSHGLILQANYTYGHAIDDASAINIGTPVVVQDENNLAAERGRSAFDIRHQFGSTFSYDLPFGPSKRWLHDGWVSDAFRDLKISGVITIATGPPFTARVLGNAADNTGTGVDLSQRADQIGNPALPASQRDPLHFFNTDAFVLPPPGQFGNAARNTITGPGTQSFDFALTRKFKFGQDARRQLEWRWEISNAFNTPNYFGLDTVVNSSTYGQILNVKNMRRMDLYLKVSF
jgi:hypothetical protein